MKSVYSIKIFLVILAFTLITFSQGINISGVVFDSDTLTVGNAEILLQNQDVSVVSDSNGVFSLSSTSIKTNSNQLSKISQSAQLINNTLSITSTKNNQTLQIKAFNLQGKVVKEVKHDNISKGIYSINIANSLSSQSNGLYILKIKIGKDQFIKRFLKSNKNNTSIQKSLNLKRNNLNRQSLVIDTIIINRANYKSKKIPINSYQLDLSSIYLDNDTNSFEINENVVVVSDSIITFIDTNSTNDSIIINIGSIALDSIKVGDILASAPYKTFPSGLLRKVTSVSRLNNQIIIQTENAALTDAIDNCNISISGTLQADSSIQRTVLNIGLKNEFNDYLKTTGSAAINIGYNLDIKIEKVFFIPILKKFEFKYIFDVDYNLNMVLSAPIIEKETIETKIFEQNFAPIILPTGFLPIYIQPKFQAHLGVEYEASLAVNIGANKKITEEIGIRKYKNMFVPFFKFSDSFSEFDLPTVSADLKANVKPYLKGTLNYMFGDLVGPYGGIKLYLNGEFKPNSNPWWNLLTGIEPVAGVKLEVLNKTILDTSFTPVEISIEKLLAMAGPKGFTCNKEGDNIIASWNDDFSGADYYNLYASKSALISTDNYDKKYKFSTTSCTLPISEFEIDNRWHFIVTAYNENHKVESQSSAISSINIEKPEVLNITFPEKLYGKIPYNLKVDVSGGNYNSYGWQFCVEGNPDRIPKFSTKDVDTLIYEPLKIDRVVFYAKNEILGIDTSIFFNIDIVALDTIQYFSCGMMGERDWFLRNDYGNILKIYVNVNYDYVNNFFWDTKGMGEIVNFNGPSLTINDPIPGIYDLSLETEIIFSPGSSFPDTIRDSHSSKFEILSEPKINANILTGDAPLVVTFTAEDNLEAFDSYKWRSKNGLGLIGEEKSLTYTFNNPGIYTIYCEVTISDCPPGKKCEDNMPVQYSTSVNGITITVNDPD